MSIVHVLFKLPSSALVTLILMGLRRLGKAKTGEYTVAIGTLPFELSGSERLLPSG